MQEISTTIKFIAGGSGDIPLDVLPNNTALTDTFDATFPLILISIALVAICVGIFFFLKNKIFKKHSRNQILVTFASLIIFVSCGSLFFASSSFANTQDDLNEAVEENSINTDEKSALVTQDVTGTVDMQSGDVTFGEAQIRNNTDEYQLLWTLDLCPLKEVAIDDAIWTISVDGAQVFQGAANDEIVLLDYPAPIAPNDTSVMTFSVAQLSKESAISLIDKDVVSATFGYKQNPNYYVGRVQSMDENSNTEYLKGAQVTFTPSSALQNENSATTKITVSYTGGWFIFIGIAAGTPGTINVDYTDGQGNQFSDDPHSAEVEAYLGKFTLRKLTTLQVSVYQSRDGNSSLRETHADSLNSRNYGLQQTFWLPAFDSLSNEDVIFYNSSKIAIEPADTETNTYAMSDLYDNQTQQMVAYSFAFCKPGLILNCYQTTDANFAEAFGDKTTTPSETIAKSFTDTFWTINTSAYTGSRCIYNGQTISGNNHGVYFNQIDSQSWSDRSSIFYGSKAEPLVNGVKFGHWDKAAETFTGFLGAYSKYENQKWFSSSVLSASSDFAFSSLASQFSFGNCWQLDAGAWNSDIARDESECCVVISYQFKS